LIPTATMKQEPIGRSRRPRCKREHESFRLQQTDDTAC
jgi:hypothetical protein